MNKTDYPYYIYDKSIPITGLRTPKCIQYKENIVIIGSKLYLQECKKLKYLLYINQINEEFKLIENTEILINLKHIINDYTDNINISSWIRDIYKKDNTFFFLIEIKKNIINNYFEYDYYLIKTDTFIDFELIKKYNNNLDSSYLFIDYHDHLFTSKVTKTTDNIWGKYLFDFKIDDKWINPVFDKIVNYDTDEGHALHNIDYNESDKLYTIIFSVRYYDEREDNKFKYKCYTAKSFNLINFFSTDILQLDYSYICDISWVCYLSKFTYKDSEYIICNKNDYGKKSYPLLFKKYLINNKVYKLFNNNFKYDIQKNLITQIQCKRIIDFIFNLKNENKLYENKIQFFERTGFSKLQNTPHCYNCYIFDWNNINLIPELNIVFKILKDNYEKYTDNNIDDVKLYPQLIHYPDNGGFIGIHYHPLYKQFIGQVLLLQNSECCDNGFYLKYNNNFFDLSKKHNIGDLLIFKFNLLHGVSPTLSVNEKNNLIWNNNEWYDNVRKISFHPKINNISGRWVAVLTQL